MQGDVALHYKEANMVKSIVYAYRWFNYLSVVAEKDGHKHEWWATDDEAFMLGVLRSYKYEWKVTVKRRGTVVAVRGQ